MILSHLSSLPQFKLLKQQRCYQKYIKLLSPKWQKAIAFVYIKNDTLFIAIKHPGFKMELNYNRDLLKSLLMQLSSHDSTCSLLRASKVVIFHSRYYAPQKPPSPFESVPYYGERAQGRFSTPQNPKLQQHFERIKELIACNR